MFNMDGMVQFAPFPEMESCSFLFTRYSHLRPRPGANVFHALCPAVKSEIPMAKRASSVNYVRPRKPLSRKAFCLRRLTRAR